MAQYADLTDEQFIRYSATVPGRAQPAALHDYVESTRALINGADSINIPESHRKLLRGENHEGSNRLNARVRQLAAWFSAAQPRFSVMPSGPGDVVRRGSSVQERFMRAGERQLARGTRLNRWRQQVYRDVAEVGVGIVQMSPRKGYYLYAKEHPDTMAEGSLLTDIIYHRRIDPATFSWVATDEGDTGLVVILATRSPGEIALKVGLEEAQRTVGFFDFGPDLDPTDPESWDPGLSVEVAEVWGANNGALVITGGNGRPATNRFGPSTHGRIIAHWKHNWGRPPFYVIAASTWPWHSPLDEMIQLTNERNFWASMLDLQASGAIFRHWQLIDTNTGEDMTDRLPRDAAPEHLRYDLSKPPPNMGPNTEWQLAPFEFHDVTNRYQQIVFAHEAAGASVARLIGQGVNQNTAVGTADMIDDAARDEFADWIEAIEASISERWVDFSRWYRTHHQDPIIVHDVKRDSESEEAGSFLNVETQITPADVVSEHIEVTLDTRSRIQKVADFRFAVEKIGNGMSDFDREVELGNIPGVDDAESEKLAIFIAEAERIEAQVDLMAFQREAMQSAGLTPEADPGTQPRFLEGTRTDPRGTGTGRGPANVSDTALAEGASDTLRSA